MIFQKFEHRLKENSVFISRDLVCFKFTTTERCSKISRKLSDLSENITFTSGVVVSQFFP